MGKKYRFRKMYFICEDNKIITPEVWATNAYQYQDKAMAIARQKSKTRGMYIVNEKPLVHTVEGFYLVHESLFEALLKEHSK